MFFKRISTCKECSLYKNQPPLLDKCRPVDFFFVGLSAVKVDIVEDEIPLSSKTNSGKLIEKIEDAAGCAVFYKTNIVKCLPLKGTKIRYPSQKEMLKCYKNFNLEIEVLRPKAVFLLGKIVSEFVLGQQNIKCSNIDGNFNYNSFDMLNSRFVPVHHPSYIQIYKRKMVDLYISSIKNICIEIAS